MCGQGAQIGYERAWSVRDRPGRPGRRGRRSERAAPQRATSARLPVSAGVGTVTGSGPAKWQATGCPWPRSISAGSSSAQISLRDRAARPEPAPRRRIDRAGDVTGEEDPPPFALGHRVGLGDRRQERLRVRVRCVVVQLVGRPDLDQLAEVHHRHHVAHVAHDRQVVGDEQVAEAELLLQVLEQVDHAGLDADVERGDGLVEHDERRVERERPGDADPLALTAGELVREALGVVRRQADQLEQLTRPASRGRPAPSG